MYRTSKETWRAQSKVGPLKGRGRELDTLWECVFGVQKFFQSSMRIGSKIYLFLFPVSATVVVALSKSGILVCICHHSLTAAPSYRVRVKAGLSQKPGNPDLLRTPSVSYTPTTSPHLTPPYLHLSLVATLIKSVVLRPWLLPPLPDPCICNIPSYVKVYVD